MKRFTAGLFAVLCVFPVLASALWAGGSPKGTQLALPVTFRTSKAASVLGSNDTDSSTVTQSGGPTTATIDTSTYIPLANVDFFSTAQAAMTTAYDVGKLVFRMSYTASGAAVDSVFYAIDTSWDGGATYNSTTIVSTLLTTAGDTFVTARLTADSDAGNNDIWGCPGIRIRVRTDGNGGNLYRLSAALLFWPINQP